MNIPDDLVFTVDKSKPISTEYKEYFDVCFTCAVRFVMEGRIVQASLDYDQSPICWNDKCPTRSAEDLGEGVIDEN